MSKGSKILIEPAERDHRPPPTGGVKLYVGDGGESFREGARRWEPEPVDWGEWRGEGVDRLLWVGLVDRSGV
jgi:hypothetical protein